MATCISILGDDRKAITLEKEALSIREKALGKESDAYSVSLHSLAVLNSSTGNYVEAIKYETESLCIFPISLASFKRCASPPDKLGVSSPMSDNQVPTVLAYSAFG